MFQTSINEYTNLIAKKLPEYLSLLPDPSKPIKECFSDLPTDNKCAGLPVEWFDVAAMTALIRNHKDSKGQYEVNCYLVEMLTIMFRLAVFKLGWLEDKYASILAGKLAYDQKVNTEDYISIMNEFCFAVRRFPYSIENQVWYSFMLPLLAYTKQSDFNKSNYLARFLVNTINRNGMMENDGSHARDLNVDILRCISNASPLLEMCKADVIRCKDKCEYYRNVLAEYATIQLGCILRRSAITEDFGKIASEIVAYHYAEYCQLSQIYFNKLQNKEYPG